MSASKGVEFVKKVFDKAINYNNFSKCMKNTKLVSVNNGICKVEYTVEEEHLNLGGFLHGGFISTLVDSVSTFALMSQGSGTPGVSVNLNVSFMKAAFPGDNIVIDARLLRTGKSLAFLEVEIVNKEDGSIIATGQHIKYLGSGSLNSRISKVL